MGDYDSSTIKHGGQEKADRALKVI